MKPPVKPKVTDAGLFRLALSAGESGISHAIAQLNNIFLRAGEKYEMKPTQQYSPVPVFISRDLEGGEEIELALEIRHYTPPDKKHYHGCEYDPGEVEFGDASTLDGKIYDMTPRERESAEEQARKQIFG